MRARPLIFLALFVFSLPSVAHAADYYHGWDVQLADSAASTFVSLLAVDAAGNTYVTGHLDNSIDFGGGTLVSAGALDAAIAKYDPMGNHIWSANFGDASNQRVTDIVVDPAGGVILLGFFAGSVDFGGGALVAGGDDIFLVRFDGAGNHSWSKAFGGPNLDQATGVAVHPTGKIAIIGKSTSPSIDFGGGAITTNGSYDLCVAMFDMAGNHIWSSVYGDASQQHSNRVRFDASGNIVMTGYFSGSIDFGGGPIGAGGTLDVFVAKLDGAGTHIWSGGYGGPGNNFPADVGLDAVGDVVVTGRFAASIDFGGGVLATNGGDDVFLAKLSGAGGAHMWSAHYGSSSGSDQAGSLNIDNAGNVTLAATIADNADFGGGVLTAIDRDAVLARYDGNGNHLSSARFGGASDDYALSVVTDAAGNILLTTRFTSVIDLGGGYLFNAASGFDVAVTKFHSAPDIATVHDIPGDQGGVVSLAWDRSSADTPGEHAITEYTVWRSIDQLAAAAMMDRGTTVLEGVSGMRNVGTGERVIRRGELAGAPFYWELMHTVAAYQQPGYSKPVETLYDSTSVSGQPHYFQVIAHTSDPYTFYTSAPDSAHSVDNLAPAPPAALVAGQTAPEVITLEWNANSEPDLSHYNVYRGTDPGFVPGIGTFLTTTLDTMSTDGSWTWDAGYWYKVSAVDIHENESVFAVVGPDLVTAAGETPRVSSLEQNVPNPFNPVTTIAFTLREAADVTLAVYDAAGRHVRTLASGEREVRRYDVTWDGRDDRGNAVASGVYFYRLTAGSFTQTKKMVLLK